jgi:hypothetical protein
VYEKWLVQWTALSRNKKIKKPKLLLPEKDLNNPDLSAKM